MNFQIFKKYPELRYGLSMKSDGSMKVISAQNKDKIIIENRKKYFSQLNIPMERVVSVLLVHGNKVEVVGDKKAGQIILDTDGLITNTNNLFLSITVADCFPLYFYDPIKQIIGISHAGWRGIVGGIVENTVDKFKKQFDSNSEDIILSIGPGILKCHFITQEDVIGHFKNYKTFVKKKSNGYQIDLSGIIIQKARANGLTQIESSGLCAHCLSGEYFSYRRDKPKVVQVMAAYIGLSGEVTNRKGLVETKSAGGVVVNQKGQVIVVNQNGATWSLPKGHIEEGEDALTAAKREIYEESGVSNLTLIKELGNYQRYKMDLKGNDYKSEVKNIFMFLFKTNENLLKPIDPNNPEARWVRKEKVTDLLTHEKDKEFFLSVINEIK